MFLKRVPSDPPLKYTKKTIVSKRVSSDPPFYIYKNRWFQGGFKWFRYKLHFKFTKIEKVNVFFYRKFERFFFNAKKNEWFFQTPFIYDLEVKFAKPERL